MDRHQLAPNPNNYTVWYNYGSGDWPSLTHTLDILLSAGERLTEQHNAALYTKFCSTPYEAVPVHLIANRMETELTAVLGSLERSTRNTSAYGEFLESASNESASLTTSEGVRFVIGRLVEQTRAMSMQSLELEQQLQASLTEVAKLKDELEGARREALLDPLTGIGNRKMFECVLREATMGSKESGEPVSLLLIDIDHFKQFNDDFGHVIGDQVLKLLAIVLGENIKGQDTATRFGGEEFAVVLPRTAGGDARKLADVLRRRISERKLVNRKTGERLRQVTVSIGVAEFNANERLGAFVERADRALYVAKQMGRNRVIAEEDVHGNVGAAA